jgi:hypothetical protein
VFLAIGVASTGQEDGVYMSRSYDNVLFEHGLTNGPIEGLNNKSYLSSFQFIEALWRRFRGGEAIMLAKSNRYGIIMASKDSKIFN